MSHRYITTVTNLTTEVKDRITRIEVEQSHQREDMSSIRMNIEALGKMNWRHISVSVSAIVFTAIVLIGAGQMYFSLVSLIHGVEDKLETRISAVETKISDIETRMSAVEDRMSSLEDQMVKGFDNLISIIENLPLNRKNEELSALTKY